VVTCVRIEWQRDCIDEHLAQKNLEVLFSRARVKGLCDWYALAVFHRRSLHLLVLNKSSVHSEIVLFASYIHFSISELSPL
jgi:hypothetical protein